MNNKRKSQTVLILNISGCSESFPWFTAAREGESIAYSVQTANQLPDMPLIGHSALPYLPWSVTMGTSSWSVDIHKQLYQLAHGLSNCSVPGITVLSADDVILPSAEMRWKVTASFSLDYYFTYKWRSHFLPFYFLFLQPSTSPSPMI